MKVILLKGIVSIFGTFGPGEVTDVPIEKIAESWCRSGIAEEVFHCEKHNAIHKSFSSIGKRCLQRIQEEEAEAKAEEIRIIEESRLVEEREAESGSEEEESEEEEEESKEKDEN